MAVDNRESAIEISGHSHGFGGSFIVMGQEEFPAPHLDTPDLTVELRRLRQEIYLLRSDVSSFGISVELLPLRILWWPRLKRYLALFRIWWRTHV